MSIMICSKCEKVVDTDFEDYDFSFGLCVDCWRKMQDEIDEDNDNGNLPS